MPLLFNGGGILLSRDFKPRGYFISYGRMYDETTNRSESLIIPSAEMNARQRPAIPGDIPDQYLICSA